MLEWFEDEDDGLLSLVAVLTLATEAADEEGAH